MRALTLIALLAVCQAAQSDPFADPLKEPDQLVQAVRQTKQCDAEYKRAVKAVEAIDIPRDPRIAGFRRSAQRELRMRLADAHRRCGSSKK